MTIPAFLEKLPESFDWELIKGVSDADALAMLVRFQVGVGSMTGSDELRHANLRSQLRQQIEEHRQADREL